MLELLTLPGERRVVEEDGISGWGFDVGVEAEVAVVAVSEAHAVVARVPDTTEPPSWLDGAVGTKRPLGHVAVPAGTNSPVGSTIAGLIQRDHGAQGLLL